jgi:hypothetical protein
LNIEDNIKNNVKCIFSIRKTEMKDETIQEIFKGKKFE